MAKRTYFAAIRDGLKRDWPAKYPVKVRIRIEWCDESQMVYTLLHEWAHALEWHRRCYRTYHHRWWAKRYAEIYQWYEELTDG